MLHSMGQHTEVIEVTRSNPRTIRTGENKKLRIERLVDRIGFMAICVNGGDQEATLWHFGPEETYKDRSPITEINDFIAERRRDGWILHAAAFIVAAENAGSRRILGIAKAWGHALVDGSGENRSPIPILPYISNPGSGLQPGVDVEVSFVKDGQGVRHDLSTAQHQTVLPLRPY